MGLCPVANRATRGDVALDTADGETRLVAQALGEVQKTLRVGEVADEPERHSHRASAFAAAARHQIEEAPQIHVRIEFERGADVGFSDPFGSLPRARIAEASG